MLRRPVHALGFALALLLTLPAHAADVRGIKAQMTDPLTPRGGVLMVQLTADRAGRNWPASLSLTLRDGTAIPGVVAWVESAEPIRTRGWTDDPRGLTIRVIEPTDDNTDPSRGVPYLLVRVPSEVAGELKLDRQTLKPVWLDMPEAAAFVDRLAREVGPHVPDFDSPFEHWRWCVLADRLGRIAPDVRVFDEPEALLAEHLAGLWRIGLARLERIDSDLAQQTRELLTRTATDRGMPFATWVADPAATGTLLTELVSTRQADESMAEFVRYWIDEHDRTLLWPEADYDTTLRLAVVSPHEHVRDMSVRWPGEIGAPLRFSVEPNVLMRVLCAKPRLTEDPIPTVYGRQPTQGERVVVQIGASELTLPIRPRRTLAVPPGVFLGELGPPLSLAEIQAMRRLPARSDQATLVSIRKLGGRWEVFVDCRRPTALEPTDTPPPANLPEDVTSFDVLRGTEAVTILVGPERLEEGLGAIVTVPEHGWPRVYFGVQDGSLQVHRRSHADRWHARIVLPEGWLPHPELGPALFGFIRTHGESDALETGPNSTVPWRTEPGRVALDLSEWEGAAGN